jgi:hypothetical protein
MKIYTMTKEVRGCDDCPLARLTLAADDYPICGHPIMNNERHYGEGLPDWCPLPDAAEVKNEN